MYTAAQLQLLYMQCKWPQPIGIATQAFRLHATPMLS